MVTKEIEFPGFGTWDVTYSKETKSKLFELTDRLKLEVEKKIESEKVTSEKDKKFREEALEILKNNPMEWMLKQSEKMYVGDLRPCKLCKLTVILSSVPSAEGINLDVGGDSETGKSLLFEAEIIFVPDDISHTVACITNKAAFYNKMKRGTILYVDEKEITDKAEIQTMKATIGSWQYSIKENISVHDGKGDIRVTPERLTWWMTHNTFLDDEAFISRLFKISAHLTDEQRKEIIERQKEIYAGIRKKILSKSGRNVQIHKQIYKILLEDKSDVAIPEKLWDESSVNMSSFRNNNMFADIVRSIAKLNMFKRERDENNAIIATSKDIEKALNIWKISKLEMKEQLTKEHQIAYKMLKKESEIKTFQLDGYVPRTDLMQEFLNKKRKISDSHLTQIMQSLMSLKPVIMERISDISADDNVKNHYYRTAIAYKLITKEMKSMKEGD